MVIFFMFMLFYSNIVIIMSRRGKGKGYDKI